MLQITHQEAAEPSPAHALILGNWLDASLLEASKLGIVRKQPFDLFSSRIEGNTGWLTWLVLAGFDSKTIRLSLILSTRNQPLALPKPTFIFGTHKKTCLLLAFSHFKPGTSCRAFRHKFEHYARRSVGLPDRCRRQLSDLRTEWACANRTPLPRGRRHPLANTS